MRGGRLLKLGTQSEIMKLAGLDLYESARGKERGREGYPRGEEASEENPFYCGYPNDQKELDPV